MKLPLRAPNVAGILKIARLSADNSVMTEKPRMNLRGTRAYELFCSELGGQVERMRSLFGDGEVLSVSEVTDICRIAHTIKGGAGFFSLDEVAAVAARLEAIFLQFGQVDPAEVAAALQTLDALSRNLPPATEGVERCRTS